MKKLIEKIHFWLFITVIRQEIRRELERAEKVASGEMK